MFRHLIWAVLIVLSGILGAASCDRNNQGKPVPPDCEGVICTMMFASVTVQVQDAAGNPVLLDSTVTWNATGTKIHKGLGNANGIYTIVDDSYQKILALRTEQFRFSGYKSGRQLVDQEFSVSADCCHVSRAQGPAVLSVK